MSRIKEKTMTMYQTTDGEEFHSIKDAEKHQGVIDGLRWFLVRYGPDLTEGRVPFTKQGYVVVNANDDHKMFATHACYKVLGSPITFVQGVFGSNAITPNWDIKEQLYDQIEHSDCIPVIIEVEERFARMKVFGEGIHEKSV